MTADTFSTQGVGSKGQNIYFSESGHVAYQMKGKELQSNMQKNFALTHTTYLWGWVFKVTY